MDASSSTSSAYVSLTEISSVLTTHNTIGICGHINPDGDCIGSMLGLYHALKSLGKEVYAVINNGETIEYGLRFLDGIDELMAYDEFLARQISCDVFVSVDVPIRERLGDVRDLYEAAGLRVSVDHHEQDGPMAEYSFVDVHSPSNTMLIWQLIKELKVVPTSPMASACYTGLMTDTGRFQYQNTTSEALLYAGEMVQYGVNPSDVAREIFQNRSRASLELERIMLDRMEFHGEGAFVLSYITAEDFEQAQANKTDAEPLIDVMRSVRGVRVACLMREQDEKVKGSFRAKDNTDVEALARRLGGGGHKAAAGFAYSDSIENTCEIVRSFFAELSRA